MTKVLIPTDFSENAWNAIAYAIQFFAHEPTQFYLLHVSLMPNYNDKNLATNSIVFGRNEVKGVHEELDLLEQKINEIFPRSQHQFQALHEFGLFVDTVKNTIKMKEIDFIVMGTKGASGLKEAVIGSRTREVLTRIKCPLLIIPEKAAYSPPKEIVFPTDFNAYFKSKVLLTLAEITAMNASKVRVLNLSRKEPSLTPTQVKNKNYLDDFLENAIHSFHFDMSTDFEESLQHFIEEYKIDMIAMVAKNLNVLQRIFFEPRVAKISYHIKIPFLVLHE
ncbi:MAG: universal stress protein [Bacteroidetes bacterium]|nr:universal stress protein [Bacteroidota bacterium]